MPSTDSESAREPLLLALAAKFPTREPPMEGGWIYRRDIGAWVDIENRDSLMVSVSAQPKPPHPRPTPDRPKPSPQSKKADVETGEDMKGA